MTGREIFAYFSGAGQSYVSAQILSALDPRFQSLISHSAVMTIAGLSTQWYARFGIQVLCFDEGLRASSLLVVAVVLYIEAIPH